MSFNSSKVNKNEGIEAMREIKIEYLKMKKPLYINTLYQGLHKINPISNKKELKTKGPI